jgi:hypothetical protein
LIRSIISDDNYGYQREHPWLTHPRKSHSCRSEAYLSLAQKAGGIGRCLVLEDSRGVFGEVQDYPRIGN